MYGEINAAGGQSFFDLFGKHSFSADHGQGNVSDLVAGGVDDLDFDFVTASPQQGRDVV
jgi:hypothetical protein